MNREVDIKVTIDEIDMPFGNRRSACVTLHANLVDRKTGQTIPSSSPAFNRAWVLGFNDTLSLGPFNLLDDAETEYLSWLSQ